MTRATKNPSPSLCDSDLPPFLPVTRAEVDRRGRGELDVIIVTGDAYVDHPSFPAALLGRLLEANRFRVGIIAQPRPDCPDHVARLGRPRLFFAVAPGAVDSMINNYTAQKRRRRTDAYAPGGMGHGRPNRALIAYCNMIRRAFGKSAAILGGGIEASLRRFAHYDFWDDAVRRAILLDAPADALIYGMGERPLIEIAQAMRSRAARSAAGTTPADTLAHAARGIRGAVYRTAASEAPPEGYRALPSLEDISRNPDAAVAAFRKEIRHRHTGLFQDCAGHRVVVNPPPAPLTTRELDAVYAMPFSRMAHPSYKKPIPALEQVRFSVTSHRGCFGGCAFCGVFSHQGKTVQSRSRQSILAEVERITAHPAFKGTVRDIGGPTANMWNLACTRRKPCARTSCLAPEICRHLHVDQHPYVSLLDQARRIKGVKHLFVSTGVRMDLALQCEPFITALADRYTSGHAKVAPEHVVPKVLDLMMKPDGKTFLQFLEKFRRASSRAGKEQYVLPYFIAAHPGATLDDAVEVALFLRREHLRVEQCQIFTPIPGTASAVMYATGINPFTGKAVFVERDARRRSMHKALVLYHLAESRKHVLHALELCGRRDLIPVLLKPRQRRRATTAPSRRERITGAHRA